MGIVLLVAIPITIFVAGQKQETRKKAAPATMIAVTPSSITKKTGDSFTVEITIDTGENQVVAAELHVVFDAAKLTAQSIKNGALFPNILSSGTVETGKASITVGAADAKQPVRGTGTIATVQFQALEKTTTPVAIALGSNSFVGGLGEGAVNVLAGTTPSSVTITEAAALASPTPTPLPTPIPTIASGSPTNSSESAITVTLSPSPTQAAAGGTTLTIVSPESEKAETKNTPSITGKAKPGAVVTITVFSTPQTATVTADENGNWSFTPAKPLESGPHNIVASVTDENGQTQTATTAFVVSAETASGDQNNVIPVSGTIETTILLLVIGIIALGVGLTNLRFL